MVNEQPLRPGRPSSGAGYFIAAVAAVFVAFVAGILIGRAGGGTGTATGTSTRPSTQATATATTAPTPGPTSIALSGTGSKVLPVDLQAGRYKVDWSAQGHDNFIVTVLGDNQINVVNEIPPNPASGETVLTVRDAGSYQLEVKASTLTWTVTLTRLA